MNNCERNQLAPSGIDIVELLTPYEEALGESLQTHTQRMNAVANGAIGFDDLGPIVRATAAVADEAQKQEERDTEDYQREELNEFKPQPYWSELAPSCLRSLLKECNPEGTAARQLLEMGRIADEYDPHLPTDESAYTNRIRARLARHLIEHRRKLEMQLRRLAFALDRMGNGDFRHHLVKFGERDLAWTRHADVIGLLRDIDALAQSLLKTREEVETSQ